MESRGTRRFSQGQSILEFALVLPLLLIVIVGVFDLGRAFFALISINNAAREGARYGTLNMLDSTITAAGIFTAIQNAAISEASGSGITIAAANVSATCPDDGWSLPANKCQSGHAVKVTVTYTFRSLLNFIIASQFTMRRSVQMAVP